MAGLIEMPRNAVATIAVLVVLGFGATLVNLELPIVRNSLLYAKALQNIVAHDGNPLPVIADEHLSYAKPVGFSMFCAPFVWLVGVNAGLKLGSFVATAALVVVAYLFFARLNPRVGIDPSYIPLELGLLFFNPLGIYQFWSAYPDSLFAAQVLMAMLLCDTIVHAGDRDVRPQIGLLGLVIYASILTKMYGLVLGLACPVYLIAGARSLFAADRRRRARIGWLAVVFAMLGVVVVTARLGFNPTIDLGSGEAGGLSVGTAELARGLSDPTVERLTFMPKAFAATLLVSFSLALPFLFRGGRSGWPLAPTAFAAVYLLGLSPFGTDLYNLRYFIPVLPFVALAIVRGVQLAGNGAMTAALLVGLVAVTTSTTLNYNVEVVHRAMWPLNQLVVAADRDDLLDNLRLGEHLELADQIDAINGHVPPSGVLVYSSSYYEDATHGVIETLGLRSDIDVVLARSLSDVRVPPDESEVHSFRYESPSDWGFELNQRFVLRQRAPSVFRLQPAVALIEPRTGQRIAAGGSVSIAANAYATSSSRATVERVELLVDGDPVAELAAPPFETMYTPPRHGRYELSARMHDSEGNVIHSAPQPLFVAVDPLERLVARPRDDAEESLDGSVDLDRKALSLGTDPERGAQLVGLRFKDIALSRDFHISRVHLQFSGLTPSDDDASLSIRFELSTDAPRFTAAPFDLSSRPRTGAEVSWKPTAWEQPGARTAAQRTPDLTPLVRELFEDPEFRPGGALVVLIEGTGLRAARSYEGARVRSLPLLHVEYADMSSKQSFFDRATHPVRRLPSYH